MDFKKPYQPQEFTGFLTKFLPQYLEKNEPISCDFSTRYITSAKLKGQVSSHFEGNLKNLPVFEFLHDSENDPRVGVTQDAFRILKGLGYSRALGIFYSTTQDSYRFSFLFFNSFIDENQNLGRTYSNPKRFSFLLGPKAKINTAKKQLLTKIPLSSEEDLKQKFSVEAVNKEFYEKIQGFFSCLAGEQTKSLELQLPSLSYKENKQIYQEFAVRLIGRLLFCWFLKEKRSLSQKPLLPEELLSAQNVHANGSFYHQVLENLFFEVLNKKQEDRPKEVKENPLFDDIPFLNGGLFDHKPHDYYEKDKNYALKIENDWFVRFFNFLSEYNFTVDENTSSHQEISVDPEMLGRIFENLLGEINPETSDSAKKETGSFYTPRPIVDYMVQESLHQYLMDYIKKPEVLKEIKTGFETQEDFALFKDNSQKGLLESAQESAMLKLEEKIAFLMDSDFEKLEKTPFLPYERKILKTALKELKILDPACGSGAFPMGILQKIMEIHRFLQPSKQEMQEALKKSKPHSKQQEELSLSKGDYIVYNPDNQLNIVCQYLGKGEFSLTINNQKFGSFRVNDLTLFVKKIISVFNKQRNSKTIANLFSQGHIVKADGTKTLSFNTLRNQTPLKRIVCKEENLPLWEYQDYNTLKTSKKDSDKESLEKNALEDSEYLNALYDYQIKEQIIEQNLFGVDIQPIAVEIARLRCFLSLVVEEKVIDGPFSENRGIKPLPNLAFKFVCANTLISLSETEDNLFGNEDIVSQLKEIRKEYFYATYQNKKEVKKEFMQLKNKLQSVSKKEQQLSIWDPFSNETTPWFDAFWMFGVEEGFDIVIGNPPYIQLQNNGGALAYQYQNQGFKTFVRSGDIYCLFYEQGINLLKEKGFLCYITSNKWMRAGYGEKLRQFFAQKTNPLLLVDFGGTRVFESATVDTNILLLSKTTNQLKTKACIVKNNELNNLGDYVRQNHDILSFDSKESWVILSFIERQIKEKIEKIGTPLKDWDIRINYGIKTGFNEAFIIDGAKKDELIKQDPKSAEIIRPILRGRDIKRYSYEFADLYLLFIPWHFPLHNDPTISGASEVAEKEFKNQYPAIYNHLFKYKKQLSNRNKAETGIRYEWYALQRWGANYWEDFSKQKIVYSETNDAQNTKIAIDLNGDYFTDKTCFILIGKTEQITQHVYKMFSSRIFTWYMSKTAPLLGSKGISLTKEAVELFPLCPINLDYGLSIEEINLIENREC